MAMATPLAFTETPALEPDVEPLAMAKPVWPAGKYAEYGPATLIGGSKTVPCACAGGIHSASNDKATIQRI